MSMIDGPVLDGDGYPTDEVLGVVRSWAGPFRALVEVVVAPVFERFGTVRVEPSGGVVRVFLSTGGWSGCEEVIAELQGTALWVISWESSRRGGHYELAVPLWLWEHGLRRHYDGEEAR